MKHHIFSEWSLTVYVYSACVFPSKKWVEAFLELQWCRIINSEQGLDWNICGNEYFFSLSHDSTEALIWSVNYLEKKITKQWNTVNKDTQLAKPLCTNMWSSAAEYPNHSDHHVTWLSMVGCALTELGPFTTSLAMWSLSSLPVLFIFSLNVTALL